MNWWVLFVCIHANVKHSFLCVFFFCSKIFKKIFTQMMCKYWNSVFFLAITMNRRKSLFFIFAHDIFAYYYAKKGKFIQTEEDERNKQTILWMQWNIILCLFNSAINKALAVNTHTSGQIAQYQNQIQNWIWQASTVIHIMWQYLHENENQ